MFGRKHEPESITLCHYETTDELANGETITTTGQHCAWCGDPPDEHGSHGICAFHSAQIAEQAAARREQLRRSRGQI